MNIVFLHEYLPKIISGTVITIELMMLSLLVGLMFALLMTFISQTKWLILKAPINIYIFIVRGTPMLLQFFIIYYGSAQFDWLKNSFLWIVFKDPLYCAVFALAINTSAYTTVLLQGAIKSVPKGEMEACKALGMSKFQAMWYVIFPHAMRIALPAYSNEVIMILKGTSLASTITVLELTGIAHQIASQTYMFVNVFVTVSVVYLLMNLMIVGTFKKIEQQLAYGVNG